MTAGVIPRGGCAGDRHRGHASRGRGRDRGSKKQGAALKMTEPDSNNVAAADSAAAHGGGHDDDDSLNDAPSNLGDGWIGGSGARLLAAGCSAALIQQRHVGPSGKESRAL